MLPIVTSYWMECYGKQGIFRLLFLFNKKTRMSYDLHLASNSLPFGPKDLLVTSDPGNCDDSGNNSSALAAARCKNWELGTWYRENVRKADADAQSLADLDAFTRDERTQLALVGAGLGAVVLGAVAVLMRAP